MIYKPQWRINKYPVSAEVADERMKNIDEQYGAVTPELLLDSSREETDVMHPCFEWIDAKAAEKYRLGQAGEIIANLVYVVVSEDGKKEQQPVRAFVSVSGQKEKGRFKPIVDVLSDAEMRQVLIENALKDLQNFKNRYTGIEEFSRIISVIDETVEEVSG